MQNLVGNALKFRGEEPPRVEVVADHGREEWIVTVRDNGIGIDREDARRIFGMFSRVERRVEGSGIGLAVCRRVVEAHGGRIWVEHAEGGGSAFRFTLPFDPAETITGCSRMICGSCGRENDGGARFCAACGAQLDAGPAEAETRKVVTVVFTDVAGSTALGRAPRRRSRSGA